MHFCPNTNQNAATAAATAATKAQNQRQIHDDNNPVVFRSACTATS